MSIRNFEAYQKSTSQEFKVTQYRVRNIIGNQHWGEEGRYKEIILMNMLKRLLPNHLSVGTGFVVDLLDRLTNQIDIIIYDNRFPLIFSEGDFVVCSNQHVVGIIEVKTKIYINQIDSIFKKAHENGKKIGKHIFNGIFTYDNQIQLLQEDKTGSKRIEEALKNYSGYLNHIALGENFFIRYWDTDERKFYSMYRIEELSFPYFISNLIETSYKLSIDGRDKGNRIDYISNYLYGIEGGKENFKFREVTL